jgi:hypothetical protein
VRQHDRRLVLDRQLHEEALEFVALDDGRVLVGWIGEVGGDLLNGNLEAAPAPRLVIAGADQQAMDPCFEALRVTQRTQVAPARMSASCTASSAAEPSRRIRRPIE